MAYVWRRRDALQKARTDRICGAGRDGSGAAQIIQQKVLILIMCCRRPDPLAI
jgi:hypothetical protein